MLRSCQYGRVERVYIDRHEPSSAIVFIKFTNQLSALRVSTFEIPRRNSLTVIQAVNALESRVFNGNTIEARFYDSEAFEKGVYR